MPNFRDDDIQRLISFSHLREHPFTWQEWWDNLAGRSRAERMDAVGELARFVQKQSLRSLLEAFWSDMESPAYVYGCGTVVRWFRRAGFVSDDPAVQRPTEPITVWRGTQTCRSADGRGVSWTTDRDKARWFAARFAIDEPGWVWEATVPPSGVLGMFTDRGEEEVVVSPWCIRDLNLVERVPIPDHYKQAA